VSASARELIRTGHEDIIAEVMAGRLKMHPALKLAKPEKYGDGRNYRPGDDAYSALVRAWNRCTDEERGLLIARLLAISHPMKNPAVTSRRAISSTTKDDRRPRRSRANPKLEE
jgi:hypothetical protein